MPPGAAPTPAVSVDGLTKVFHVPFKKGGVTAVQDVAFDVAPGEVYGLIGPNGSGKSTTMASMVDWINSNKAAAILTVEDPIEVLHPDKLSVVVQREVGVDTADPADAIRSAMRHDTDVIMISEIEDMETARAAISAAETGHLVISYMRTTDPADTVHRIVSMFPETQQPVVRSQLAAQISAIVSQRMAGAG